MPRPDTCLEGVIELMVAYSARSAFTLTATTVTTAHVHHGKASACCFNVNHKKERGEHVLKISTQAFYA